MAYKLYINNKLFNGIGNNNYNKGVITINGVDYQYDNSSGSSLPTYTFYWKKTTSGRDLDYTSPNYFNFENASGSAAIRFNSGTTALTSDNTIDGITFDYYVAGSSSYWWCEILLSDYISDNNINISDYDITVKVYLYCTSNKQKKLIIGNGSELNILTGLNVYNGTLDINNNIIKLSDNAGRWSGIYVTLTPKS